MENSFRNMLLITASLSALNCCSSKNIQSNSQEMLNETTQKSSNPNQRIRRLQTTPEWIAFKVFWQKLDTIQPPHSEESHPFGGIYAGAINYQDAQALQQELNDLIRNLELISNRNDSLTEIALIDSLEVDILSRLTSERINYMQQGQPSMYTRMVIMPHSVVMDREESYVKLEKQIDILLQLKKEEKISGEEYKKAIEAITQSVKEFAVLDVVHSYKGGLLQLVERSEDDSISVLEKYLAYFKKENHTTIAADSQSREELKKIYTSSKEKVVQIEAILPALSELVESLEK